MHDVILHIYTGAKKCDLCKIMSDFAPLNMFKIIWLNLKYGSVTGNLQESGHVKESAKLHNCLE